MYILNPQVSYFLLQCATFQKTFFFTRMPTYLKGILNNA